MIEKQLFKRRQDAAESHADSAAARPSVVTMLDACRLYEKPYREVRRAFIYGGLGRRDDYDVWFAQPSTLKEAFGKPKAAITQALTYAPAANQRAAARLMALYARVHGGGEK